MNIFSSKNELSNNYKIDLEIDGKNWKNVSHYIYSNLLHDEIHKKILKNNLKNISKNFYELSAKEQDDLIVETLTIALPVKFANVELANKLISTGNKSIVYRSFNNRLGVDDNGKGHNIYGKMLMSIRKTLKEKMNLQYKIRADNETKELIYRSYLVKHFLEDYMLQGINIRMFSDMSVDSIYDMISGDYREDLNIPFDIYNRFQLYKQTIDKLQKDVILGFVEPELKSNPKRVVEFVLKTKLRNMQIMLQELRKTVIYDMYLENFLSRKGMNNDDVKDAFGSYVEVIHNKERFKKYLQTAYDTQVLPKKLQNSIYNVIKNFKIPTDSEVKNAESIVFEVRSDSKPRVEIETTKPRVEIETKDSDSKGKLSSFDRFLDTVYPGKDVGTLPPPHKFNNKPKISDDESELSDDESELSDGESKVEIEEEPKIYKRPRNRFGPPVVSSRLKNPSLNDDIRSILDSVMQGKEVPNDILNRNPPQPMQDVIFIDSNQPDIYFDLSPIAQDMMSLNASPKASVKSMKTFPSVSHYLMFRMIQAIIGDIERSYNMILMSEENHNFAPLQLINERYMYALLNKYRELQRKAIDIKLQNSEILQALANTGNTRLYYNDKNDDILGTGPNKNGNNFTGVYLMDVRSQMDRQSIVMKDLSPLELFVQNEDEWVENRVNDYCNVILNMGDIQTGIQAVEQLYPCPLPPINNIDVPVYFSNMVKEESSKLNGPVTKHLWGKILSICNYVLGHSRNPKAMLDKASLVIQSNEYSKNQIYKKAIEDAILNIANKINIDIRVATNIILKQRDIQGDDIQIEDDTDKDDDGDDSSSQGSIDYGSEGEQGEEGDGEQGSPVGSLYGDSPKRKNGPEVLAINVKRVMDNTNIPKNILKGRINYFQLI